MARKARLSRKYRDSRARNLNQKKANHNDLESVRQATEGPSCIPQRGYFSEGSEMNTSELSLSKDRFKIGYLTKT